MWVVAPVADGVEKFADLLGRQPRQFTLLQLEQLHPGQRVVVVDLAQVLQLIEHRADVSQFVVQGLPGYPLLQPLPPQARVRGCIQGRRYRVTLSGSQLQQLEESSRRVAQ